MFWFDARHHDTRRSLIL